IEQTPYAAILQAAFEKGTPEMTVAADPLRGGRYYFFSARVPTGGWSLSMSVAQDEILSPVRRATRESFIIAVVGTLLVIAILIALMRSITRRVELAADAATRVSDGDLTVRVDTDGGDETGALLRAVDGMVQSLRALVGAVQHSSVRLVSSANEL